MKYLFFAICFVTPVVLLCRYLQRVKSDILFKLESKKFISTQLDKIYFSTPIIKNIAKNKISALEKAALICLESLNKGEKSFEKLYKNNLNNSAIAMELAKIYFLNGKHQKAWKLCEKTENNHISTYTKAVKYYLQSFEFAQAGEMSEASQYITTALKLFDKEK